MNILILCAGHTEMEPQDGGYPPFLMEIDGLPLIERVVRNTATLSGARHIFAILEDDASRFHLGDVAQQLAPASTVVRVPRSTRGSACTALLAASRLQPDEELLIVSANELVDVELPLVIADFRGRSLDGGVITFNSVHPRYSYVRLGEGDMVLEVAQQRPISRHATTGTFYFAQCKLFVEAAKQMIQKDDHTNGNYYVAKAYNEIILQQGFVGAHRIDTRRYWPLKTERQVLQHDAMASA